MVSKGRKQKPQNLIFFPLRTKKGKEYGKQENFKCETAQKMGAKRALKEEIESH